mmetsp:Transcript_17065/g.36819  ORF Transcript_17065/g.36819 Transcript_17065/m.36819 type:complete len:216 (+) Transcript_17065:317-964(+)
MVHSEPLQDLVIIINLEGQTEIKANVGTLRAHFALNNRSRISIDNDEGKWYFLILDFFHFLALVMLIIRLLSRALSILVLLGRGSTASCHLFHMPRMVPSKQILKADILHHELLQAFSLPSNVILSLGELLLHLLHALESAQPIHIPARVAVDVSANSRSISKMVLDLASRQAAPCDLFLILGYNVHGHEDIECIVDTATDVLVVVVLFGLAIVA